MRAVQAVCELKRRIAKKICINPSCNQRDRKRRPAEKHTQRHTHTHTVDLKIVLRVCGVVVLRGATEPQEREEEEGGRKKRTMRKRKRERWRQTSPKLARWANTL